MTTSRLLPLFVLLFAGFFLIARAPRLAATLPSAGNGLNEAALNRWWAAGADCLELESVDPAQLGPIYPAEASRYQAGAAALAAGDISAARNYFQAAVADGGHPLALILLANINSQNTQSLPPEDLLYAGPWNNDMRLALARYYFWLSISCRESRLDEAADKYLEWGEQMLPAGAYSQIDIALARRIGETYVRREAWEEALPWLQHASQAQDSALLRLALTYYQLEEYQRAVESYEEALIYYPDHVSTRIAAARAAAASGQPMLGISLLKGVDNRDLLGVEGALLWAELCLQTDNTSCARQQFELVLALQPDNDEAKSGLEALTDQTTP